MSAPDDFYARQLAFIIVRMAARKHGAQRHARAARFARACGDKSQRLGRGRTLWDHVAQLCDAQSEGQ